MQEIDAYAYLHKKHAALVPKVIKALQAMKIVEDNLEMLAFLQHSLYRDYNVFCARNGREALQKLNSVPVPNLILSDITMDGYEFCTQLTQIKKYKAIPFIFLTAKTSKEEKWAGLNRGAVDFISKPFDLPELLAKIKSIVHIQEALQAQNIEEMENKILKAIRTPVQTGSAYMDFEKKCSACQLSTREIEVLHLILQARDNKEIAAMLNISYPTVHSHIQHLFDKCGVTNKVKLIKIFKQF